MTDVRVSARRFRLLRRLDESPLTVVWGPAGYGKTELVESWLAHRADIAARRIAAPGPATGPDAYWAAVASASASASASAGVAEAMVVLDLPEKGLLTNIGVRLRDLQVRYPTCRFVLTTRDGSVFDDRFPSSGVSVVMPAELEYTLDEVAELLADRHPSSRRAARDVWLMTAGHPALVALAENVLRVYGNDLELERERACLAVEVQVDRYVDTNLLEPLPPSLRTAARTVAAVRRVTETVVTMLRVDDAEKTIAALECAGLLYRMPPSPESYHVFPAAIRRSLRRGALRAGTQPPPEVSVALARWYEAVGDPVEALRHATEGQDWDLVVEVLAAHWVEITATRFGVLFRALCGLPEHVLRSRPAMLYARELAVRISSDLRPLPRSLPEVISPDSDIDGQDSFDVALAPGVLRSTLMRWIGDYDEAVRDHAELVDLATRIESEAADQGARPDLAPVWTHLGLTSEYRGDHRRAADLFERAVIGCPRGAGDFAARQAAGQLALQQAVLGEGRRAQRWIEQESTFSSVAGWLGTTIELPAIVARVIVALDRLDVAAAEHVLTTLPELTGNIENWAFVVYARAQYELMRGRPEAGLDRVQRHRTEFGKWLGPAAFARPLLDAAEMDLNTALGAGSEVLERAELVSGPLHPLVRLSTARAALLTGNTSTAAKHATALTRRRGIYTRVRLEAFLIESMVSLDSGERDAARVAWNRAVALSEDTGLARPFTTVPADMRSALSEFGTPPADIGAQDWAPYPPPASAVRLTERELAVLHGLVRGDPVVDIAKSLFVSPNTIKTQLQGLYRKLGVHSRGDAVREARRRALV